MVNTVTTRKRPAILNLLKILVTMFFILLLTTIILYFYYSSKAVEPAQILQVPSAPQMPTSPQPIQNISTFRTLPCIVNSVIIYGSSKDYLTISVSPNSSTQPNTEYGIKISYVDTGILRNQINVSWNPQDLQSKQQVLVTVKATQDEIINNPIGTGYWGDGIGASTRSFNFSSKYTYSLFSINGKTEQQLVEEQNQQMNQQYQRQLSQYQQQLVSYTQQKQDIKNQQDILNAQYLQRLSDKNTQANRMLFIFIPIDVLVLLIILYLVYLYFVKRHSIETEEVTEYPASPKTVVDAESIEDEPRIPIPNAIRNEIMQRAKNACENPECGSRLELNIHHIDMDNRNNNKKNLVVLCKNCHYDAHNAVIKQSTLRNWVNWDYARLRQRRGYQ